MKPMAQERNEFEHYPIIVVGRDLLCLQAWMKEQCLGAYRATFFEDGETALEWIRKEQRADLVVTDRNLPGMSGLDFCRQLRERESPLDLPLLLIVDAGSMDQAAAAIQAGANDFMVKPFGALEWSARMNSLLRINGMMKERIREEWTFLQAQLKPHFLFNALNSVAALSKLQPERLNALLNDIGHYLRESLLFDPAEALVPLERELRLVRAYLNIEKVRFAEWLTFEIELITEEHFLVPPLSILPLVENAVRHGIMKRANGGHIRLRIVREGADLLIALTDNGVGMEPEKLELLKRPSSGAKGGGLQTIERRLRQMLGCGLTIMSNPEQGTEIQIRLPIEKVGIHENDFD